MSIITVLHGPMIFTPGYMNYRRRSKGDIEVMYFVGIAFSIVCVDAECIKYVTTRLQKDHN